MAIIVTALTVAVAAMVAVDTPATADTQSVPTTASHRMVGDRDCGDFANQAAAQHFFIQQGGPGSDPHRLDADGDGIACESNPCPCSTSTGGGGGGHQPEPQVKRQKAVVVQVVDGDTVDVKLLPHGPKDRVRLLGIDTPEVFGGQECWGPQASDATKRILPEGTRVLLVSDPSQDLKDRYGRILRYVIKGNRDVNRTLVAQGHARVYVYQHHPFQRTKKYKVAQTSAKHHERGLWGHC